MDAQVNKSSRKMLKPSDKFIFARVLPQKVFYFSYFLLFQLTEMSPSDY